MGALVNLWTQVRRTLKLTNGGTGNTQGWGQGVIKVCTNRTGSSLALGTLVRLTLEYNDARVEPTDTAAEPDVLGVVVGYWSLSDPDTLIQAAAPSPSTVAVLTHGTVRVNLDATGATRGEYAFASATAGTANSDATIAVGAFGIFQGSGGASGTALVLLTGTQGASASGGGGSFGTPALTLSTSNAAGAASTGIRTDATVAVFDATVPVTQAMGDSAAAGSAGVTARRDHKHGMPAFGASAAAVGTSSAGAATTPSRSDHVHATGAGTPSTQAFGDAPATGTGPAAAMTDHKHGMPAAGSGVVYGAPAIVLGTAAANGSIDEAIRRDSTVVAFDTTVPVTQAFGDTAATGSAVVSSRRDHKHGMPAGPSAGTVALGLYGSGFDGSITLDGSVVPDVSVMTKSGSVYTLARDIHTTALTINAGVTLQTAGFIIFCRGTLNNAGIIDRSGVAGGTPTAGAAIALQICGGNSGIAGAGQAGTAAGGNGIAVSTNGSAGGPGGGGGASGSGQAGGSGGTAKSDTNATVNAPTQGGASQTSARGRPFDAVAFMKGFSSWGGQTNAWTSWGGGASGGGGGRGAAGGTSGGGGSGGGVLVICSSTITNSGTIRANGGAGGAGTGAAAGGGGGGGGGVVALMYDSYTNSGTVSAAAGGAGAGAGTGAAGNAGGAGNVYTLANI